MLLRQRILCHAQCSFPKARTANPCWCHWSIQGSPPSIWHQGRLWAAAHSVLVNGNNIWEFLSWNEKSSPSSTQKAPSLTLMTSRAVQSCPEKNAVEKRKTNISFSVLECGCSDSWSIFGHVYKIQLRCSSSSVLTIKRTYFYILTNPVFSGRVITVLAIKYWLSAVYCTSVDNCPPSLIYQQIPWKSKLVFTAGKETHSST